MMSGSVGAKPLLDKREQLLYGRLVRAFPGHVILVNVALSRLVVAAFAVCKADFTPLAVLELEDCVQAKGDSTDRHRRRDQLIQAAGIKVIRLMANDIPSESALKALVAVLPLTSSTSQLMRRAS
jgi:uncharacterized protein DUF2726